MGQKVNIPSQNQPFRRQASIGGNVSFRNIGDNNDNSFIALAKVTRVYYQRGKLDFKLTNTNSLVADRSGNGSGSAPIPVDFFGRRKNGQVFGHYRPVKIGDLIAVAYVNGHKSSPIVIGVYPNSGQDYEIISPSLYLDGDDEDAGVAETALAEQKIYPSMQLEYRSGSGTIAKALNGHSFLVVDDEVSHQYDKLWQNYDTVGFFHNSSDAINPLKETAGDWLLVHEDNPLSDDGDNHRTRFFVNKKGEIQIVLMDNTSSGTISVLEGSKQNGFTISQYYDLQAKKSGDLGDDVYEPDFESATKYVSLNVGKDQEIALEVAANNTSKLELKGDGLYLDGKPFAESLNDKLNDVKKDISDDIKDDISKSVPSNDDFKKLADDVAQNANDAKQAAEQAKQAGEAAKDAGLSAEKAGEDAKATGDDIKKRIIYYASISKEKDVSIPGKYIIINTDTYIADGTIKNAYIEDGAIDHAKIANEAVGSSQIEDSAITRAKIADAAIGTAQIENAAITDEKVGTLSFDHMIGATLDAGKINVINLTAKNIKAESISADKLNVSQLSDITNNAGTIDKGHIKADDDPTKGVVIDGLDADNPNKYTPARKALLLGEVQKLNSAAEAAIDYGKKTGVDCSGVEKAKQAMDDGLSSLLADMTATTDFDYNTVIKLEQALQDAINAFHTMSNSDIIAKIGQTADGKNTIYRGADEPQDPHENDVWLQILNDGSYNIRVWDGAQWINPGLADVKAVSNSLSNLPKSYYQPDEPVGSTVHDGDTWYDLTKGDDGQYSYVVYKRESGKWTPLLDKSSLTNSSSIKTLQGDLDETKKTMQQFQEQNKKDLQDLTSDLSWHKVDGPFDANAYRTTFNVFYNGTTATNTPINGNFYLITYAPDTDQVSQVLRSGDGSNTWERVYTADGGWSAWKKTVTSGDVSSTVNTAITNANTQMSSQVDSKIKASEDATNATITQNQQANDKNFADINGKLKNVEDSTSANTKAISDANALIKQNQDLATQNFTDINDQIAQNKGLADQSIKEATDLIKSIQQSTSDDIAKANSRLDDTDKTISGINDSITKQISQATSGIADEVTTKVNGNIDKKLADNATAIGADVDKKLADNATSLSSSLDKKLTDATSDINTSVDQKIDTVNSTITQNQADTSKKFDTVNGDIASANTAISNTNATVAQNKKDTDTAIANTNTQVAGNKTAISNNTKAISDTNQKVTQAQNDISSNHEMILAANAQIKKTQDSVTANVSAIGQANNKIDEVSAQLKLTTGHIQSAVEDISSNFNKLDIGGDNLLKNSDNYFDNNTKKDRNIGELTLDELNNLRGKEVTVSVNTIWNGFKQDDSQNNRLGWEASATYKEGTATKTFYLGAWKFPNSANGSERVSATFTVPDYEFTQTDGGKAYIQINGTGSVNRPQVQLGNKATAWTLGSSDINASIEKNSTLIDQTSNHVEAVAKDLEGKIAAVKLTKDDIMAVVSDPKGQVMSAINQKAESITAGFADFEKKAVVQGTNYGGLVLDKNGATLTSGKVLTYLNGDKGFLIQNGDKPIFRVDNQGNLVISGSATATGNISGVDFTGNNLTLQGSMKVNGAISSANGNVTLDSKGINIKGGGLSISDGQGKQTTYVDQYGTFITTKGVFSGDITAQSLTLVNSKDASIDVAGQFHVDSTGHVIAKSFEGTDVKITGGQYLQGTFNAPSIQAANIYSGHIYTTDLHGSNIYGGLIKGSEFSNAIKQNFSDLGGYIGVDNEVEGPLSNVKTKDLPTFKLTREGNMEFTNRNIGISGPGMFTFSLGKDTANLTYGIAESTEGKASFPQIYGRIPLSSGAIPPVRGITDDNSNVINYMISNDQSVTIGSKTMFVVNGIMPFAKLSSNKFVNKLILNYEAAFQAFENMEVTSPKDKSMTFTLIAWKSAGDYELTTNSNYEINGMKSQDLGGLKKGDYVLANNTHYISQRGSYSDVIDLSSLEGNDIGIGFIINQSFEYAASMFFSLNSLNWIADNGNGGLRITGKSTIDDSQKLTITPTGSLIQEASHFTDNNPLSTSTWDGGSFLYPSEMFMDRGRITMTKYPSSSNTSDYQLYSFIDGEKLQFSPIQSGNAISQVPRVVFNGTGSNGTYFDSYGDVHAQDGGTSWNVFGTDNTNVFNVPLDGNEAFEFNLPESTWGATDGIRIGWVSFDTWPWGYTRPDKVPAIYTDHTHLSGIAIWDRFIIIFVDGWAWNVTDHGLTGGFMNGRQAEKIGVNSFRKHADKPN